MTPKTDLVQVAAFAVVVAAFGGVVLMTAGDVEAQVASASGDIVLHDEFTVPSNLDAGVVEFKSSSGKRHSHFACEVDDDETGTLVIGDNTVSATDYGKKLTAGEDFGGPHGGEYGRATGTDAVDVHCRFVVPKL